MKVSQTEFAKELTALVNRYAIENDHDSPEFIVAQYISGCIDALEHGQTSNKAIAYAVKEWQRINGGDNV